MDDGTVIKLNVTIDPIEGSAIFDFTGTGPQVYLELSVKYEIISYPGIWQLQCSSCSYFCSNNLLFEMYGWSRCSIKSSQENMFF